MSHSLKSGEICSVCIYLYILININLCSNNIKIEHFGERKVYFSSSENELLFLKEITFKFNVNDSFKGHFSQNIFNIMHQFIQTPNQMSHNHF